MCERDFSKDLGKKKSTEADALDVYDKQTQENKIQKSMKDQDVKYKTQEFKDLDKEICITGICARRDLRCCISVIPS